MDDLSNKDVIKESINKEIKIVLAEKLKNGEVDVDNLSDEQIKEMIHFFNNSIKQKDIEIERIKQNIIDMKRKIDNNN